jgi:hypothetical protein
LKHIVPRTEVIARIGDELKQVTGGELRAEHLDQLTYLDAAIRESMRVRTIIPFVVRLTKTPFIAGGREYPPGVMLSPCSHLVHRRPDREAVAEISRGSETPGIGRSYDHDGLGGVCIRGSRRPPANFCDRSAVEHEIAVAARIR